MPIQINGTSGISGVDGSAGTPALQGTDANTGVHFPAADTVAISTNGAQRVTVDSSGRCLVGTSSARSNFFNSAVGLQAQIEGITYQAASLSLTATANNYFDCGTIVLAKGRGGAVGSNTIVQNGSPPDILGYLSFQGNDGTEFVEGASIKAEVDGGVGANDLPSRLVFSVTQDGQASPSEVMRITSARTVEFVQAGGTSGKPAGVIAPIGYVGRSGTSGSFANVFNIFWNGSAARLWIDTSDLGSITTSSDYRIKQNIKSIEVDCIDRVKQLRPVEYEMADYGELFKADGIVREGFIAHEVQEVIPSGAEGQKDEEGRIQNLRTDAIVAVLTKALQEAIAKIETLEAKVAALEAQ